MDKVMDSLSLEPHRGKTTQEYGILIRPLRWAFSEACSKHKQNKNKWMPQTLSSRNSSTLVSRYGPKEVITKGTLRTASSRVTASTGGQMAPVSRGTGSTTRWADSVSFSGTTAVPTAENSKTESSVATVSTNGLMGGAMKETTKKTWKRVSASTLIQTALAMKANGVTVYNTEKAK